MIYLQLFLTFFQIGLFGFGGGYGMLSLIQTETVVRHHWLTSAEFTNIVAISQMTPGPIGINSATYCGYTAAYNAGFSGFMAVLGSVTATAAAFLGRVAAAALLLMTPDNFSLPSVNPWNFWISVWLFIATFVGTKFLKINPIRMICWAGFAGLMLLY